MNTNIKEYIANVYKEKTLAGDNSTKTDLANSLNILSSGIYTEEERFIFELLQNAVDAFVVDDAELRIKIVVQDGFVVFMHNGSEFSIRDIEGICSVGYGEKSSNIKKIGYKGIGFKSVFMHSDHVTIQSGDNIFGFEKSHWKDFFGTQKLSETGREYEMPWQIIPILEEEPPILLDTNGYNVVTYLEIPNTKSIAIKIEKLMADCQFLLFLSHSNITIDYYANKREHSISKSSMTKDIVDFISEQVVTLTIDGSVDTRWLVYKNEKINISSEYLSSIRKDQKTPGKLQNVTSYDLSFAILLDEDGQFVPLENKVLYTYLPTSCHVKFPFLVNANFITDAGRQQLDVDTPWNQMVVSAIPWEYIGWISKLSTKHKFYYKILPSELMGIDGLEEYYIQNLKESLEKIAFVPNLSNQKLLLVAKTIYDEIGMNDGLEEDRYNPFLTKRFYEGCSADNLIEVGAGAFLQKYGSKAVDDSALGMLLEQANEYLDGFSVDECVKFCKWLSKKSKEISISKEILSYSTFLIDDKGNLAAPHELFFPSAYRDRNSIAESAKVISLELMRNLEYEKLKDWLAMIGVQEMSSVSIILNVICSYSFFDNITKEEAINAIRFIFNNEKTNPLIDRLDILQRGRLKFLTEKGNLKSASSLYLNSRDYGVGIEKDFDEDLDVFISSVYIKEGEEKLDWARFLTKLGVNDKFQLVYEHYDKGTELWEKFSDIIDLACKKERNISSSGRYYYYNRDTISIYVTTVPLLSISNNKYEMCRMVWNNIFQSRISFDNRLSDYLYGQMGYYFYQTSLVSPGRDYNYLRERFLSYALKNFNWLPGSDGNLYCVSELLENNPSNKKLCGKYLPTLDVDCQIHDSWLEYLPLKKEISLNEYLTILEKIEKDSDNGVSKENLDRISLVYRHIADKFSLEEGTSEYNIIAEWAKFHKILTSERLYKIPSDLLLVSDDLGKISIENQVFRGKHIGNYDVRFINLMKAFGVKFVDSFTPSFEGEGKVNNNFKKRLMSLSRYLSLLAVGKDATKDIYQTELEKIENEIASWVFIGNDQISLSYAGLSIERKVYVKEKEFHYVGSLGISNLELMHEAIAKGLNIPPSNRTAMMAIIQIGNVEEIREYLTEKGFDVSFVEEGEIERLNSPIVTLGEGNYLDQLAQEGLNEEARRVVLQMLAKDGFDITNKREEYSLVHGVMMNEEEFPLVIKFRKGSAMSIELNCFEWIQLMRSENSMLLIHRGNGVVEKLSFSNLFRNQDCMSIRFNIEALQHPNNILQFAAILQYFKGCHFDFSNLHTTRYESMQGYIKGQKNPNAFIDLSPDDKKLLN